MDAPAVTPTFLAFFNQFDLISFLLLIQYVLWLRDFDISYSLLVFALLLDPIIIITSFSKGNFLISSCFILVGMHMVLKNFNCLIVKTLTGGTHFSKNGDVIAIRKKYSLYRTDCFVSQVRNGDTS